MLKKIIVGILIFTVAGAAGAALTYQLLNQGAVTELGLPEISVMRDGIVISREVNNQEQGAVMEQEGFIGEPWEEVGTINEFDDTGFQFVIQSGETVYVELGPLDYWSNLDVKLDTGMSVIVEGSINEDDMIHAFQVILDDEQVMTLRSEDGQPMWSGGVDNGQAGSAGSADGTHTPEPQALVDDWITLEGTLMSFQGGNMSMSTVDVDLISFQSGQPRFFASQNVSFAIGDEIVVVGYYQNDQFKAGDIIQVVTGLRVMLLDPNGRPLWAGGGGNGNGNSNGHGGNG